ncbi:hypothetical protein N7466_004556 [Penicillium verhagenii]|uniref:uncharacterized protein n=1 Tax=Penicillium verhagenii TaxID=1562060 RepID=UPI002544D925|nr:uncharacterized protein N7466_004556 [Penicillium verhagenii]KAJ5935009.1 hypothetical protein N7466_004556 [Penicillium verhagenii]
MSLTRGHSCILCQQRKVRCDQQKPCTGCVRAQVECKVVPPQPARRKKRKAEEDDLIHRLEKYEAIMTQNGIDFHSILANNRELNATENSQDVQNSISGPGSPRPAGSREYQTHDELLRGSDDDDDDRPTIHHAFDKTFADNDGFPFMAGGSTSRITHLHPSAIQIFQLWQVYLNNVNPLLKISHVPTLQNEIIEASANLANVSKPLEALMFSIYLISITSMSKEEVQAAFGYSKNTLLVRYHKASQQALINATFMRSTELVTLQAFFIYLLSVCHIVDPRSHFCLIGIAVRVATRLGIHRDGAQFRLPPFETEQRRRLWWQLAILDKRIAEMTGSAITALSSSRTDCRLPLNVNDGDLHKHTKAAPVSSPGSTEMLFCLTRVELLAAAKPSSMRPDPSIARQRHNNEPLLPPSSFCPQNEDKLPVHGLDDYCAYIESTYLEHCDPEIPIHKFTLLTARISLCKLRVVDFMCRSTQATKSPDQERDDIFMAAVQMIEWDNEIYTAKELQGFRWYTRFQAPMSGFFFILNELRQRTTGPLCERAWKAIFNDHEHRGLVRNVNSPMHAAFKKAILKAWEAHEKAEAQKDRVVEAPELILTLRRAYLSKGVHPQMQSDPVQASSATAPPQVDQVNSLASMSTFAYMDAQPGIEYQPPGLDFDVNQLFSTLDTGSQIYDQGMMGFDETDWSSLMQSGSFGEF